MCFRRQLVVVFPSVPVVRSCPHSLSLCWQRPKPRTLHHHREESRLLAAVWRWHCGGASHSLSYLLSTCVSHWAASSTLCLCVCVRVVQKIDAQAIEEFYGLTSDISKNSESGYILFYQSRDWAEPKRRRQLNGTVVVLFIGVFFVFNNPTPVTSILCCFLFVRANPRVSPSASVGLSSFSFFCRRRCCLSPASGPHFNAKITPNSLTETNPRHPWQAKCTLSCTFCSRLPGQIFLTDSGAHSNFFLFLFLENL